MALWWQYGGIVVVLWWYCGNFVGIFWWHCEFFVVGLYCGDIVVFLWWYCGDVVLVLWSCWSMKKRQNGRTTRIQELCFQYFAVTQVATTLKLSDIWPRNYCINYQCMWLINYSINYNSLVTCTGSFRVVATCVFAKHWKHNSCVLLFCLSYCGGIVVIVIYSDDIMVILL